MLLQLLLLLLLAAPPAGAQCPGGAAGPECAPCAAPLYSYGGAAAACAPCAPHATPLSPTLGCAISTGSALYLSGAQSEGVAAFEAVAPAGLAFVDNHLGEAAGALRIDAGSALLAAPAGGSDLLGALPTGAAPFTACAWVSCGADFASAASSWPWRAAAAFVSWGDPGDAAAPALAVAPLRRVAGQVVTVAGDGGRGGANGAGSSASFNKPRHVVVDAAGDLLIADSDNYQIRRVSRLGGGTTVSAFAGSGKLGFLNGKQVRNANATNATRTRTRPPTHPLTHVSRPSTARARRSSPR